MVRLLAAPAGGGGGAACNVRLVADVDPTVTERPAPFEIVPSLTTTDTVSALYSFILSWLTWVAWLATPLVNVIVSEVPTLTTVPVLLVPEGTLPLIVAGPVKVNVLSPV